MLLTCPLCSCRSGARPEAIDLIGPTQGGTIVSTRQLIRPAGQSIEFHGRPLDLVLSPDAKTVYVKCDTQLLAIDATSWTIRQTLATPAKAGGTMHGIALSHDGKHLYLTAAQSLLLEANIAGDGALKWGRQIHLPASSYPCGLAITSDDQTASICLSMKNAVQMVDLKSGSIGPTIDVGVAPYDLVIARDEAKAYVSNWGGRRPRVGDKTADSAGTPTVVDERGVASTGSVGVIDLNTHAQTAEIPTGLHPADLELSLDGKTLYCANANSDTVSVIDIPSQSQRQIPVRPDEKLPFGSMSNAVALAGETLFVANGGNNAIAVVDLASDTTGNQLKGFIPTGWYPGAVATDGQHLFIANIKGIGSRDPAGAGKWKSRDFYGSITKADITTGAALASQTKQVRDDALVPQALAAAEKAKSGAKPVPVPKRVGEPSVIQHVVYIIKENRTYDQLLGDLPKGNNDASLCTFGRAVTPNHHALAEQFVLLDNYYCNGVISSDGHAWATEGLTVDYLEKSIGVSSRSYPFWGNDPLAYASTGFIWDNALLHGLSFRNYGEMSRSEPKPPASRAEILHDYLAKGGRFRFEHTMPIESLRKYSCPDSPGWNLRIPDQIRADVFIKELHDFEAKGAYPNLTILYLPQDHTSGTSPGGSSPEAMVADNDLAVGRVIEALSRSKFWPQTCVFVTEDDPQNGFDHVDGHRSICLIASPYTKRGQVVSHFYNQTSVLRTMELMLGLPPMNQFDAMSPAMQDCFTSKPDLTPYTATKNQIPLDQLNSEKAAMSGEALKLAEASERLPLDEPDRADEDTLNRIIWHATKGMETPYPAAYAGAHGRGLSRLHLKLGTSSVKDDDD